MEVHTHLKLVCMVHVSIVIANLLEKRAYFIIQVADGQFNPFNEHRECYELHIYLISVYTIHMIHTSCIKSAFHKLASTGSFIFSGGHLERGCHSPLDEISAWPHKILLKI